MATPTDHRDGDRARSPRRYAPRMAPAARREQLLDAALAVTVTLGYGRVSIEAIARKAGVTRPVIYDHFPNLSALLRELVEREERLAVGQLERIVPEQTGEASASALLARSVRRFLDAVAARPDTWRIILLPLEGTPAIVREHVERNRRQVDHRLEHLISLALADVRLTSHPSDADMVDQRVEVDVALAARAIRQLAEEAGRLMLTDPRRYPPERFERFAQSVARFVSAGCTRAR
jgi:AcrR family transcriptional regulator